MNLKGLTKKQRTNLRSWLKRGLELGERTRMVPLLEASVGRIAAHRIRKENAEALQEGLPLTGTYECLATARGWPHHDELSHIVDWLKSSVRQDAPWLWNVDSLGRPKKLMKCASYGDLIREADKAMDRLNAQDAKSLGLDDETPDADLAEGFRLVRLRTAAALDLESRRMHHCVGHGSYDDGVESGAIEIYSLRDPKGRPVVTIEVEKDQVRLDENRHLIDEVRTSYHISQMQGRHNNDPDPSHLAILKPFIRAAGWGGAQDYWPSVTDVDGVEHDVDAITAGTVLEKLDARWNLDTVPLPGRLTVLGNAYLGSCIEALPEGLAVCGDLELVVSYSEAPRVLPESLQVGGRIKVWNDTAVAQPIPGHLADKIEVQKPFVSRLSFMDMANIMSREQVLARFGDAFLPLGDVQIDITPEMIQRARVNVRQNVRQVGAQELREELEAELAAAPVLTLQDLHEYNMTRLQAQMFANIAFSETREDPLFYGDGEPAGDRAVTPR